MTNQIADIRGLAELFQESTRRRLQSSIRTVVKNIPWACALRANIDNKLCTSFLFVSTLVSKGLDIQPTRDPSKTP